MTVREATTVGHQPRRPGWSCRACGQEWPCPSWRADRLAEAEAIGSHVELALLMARYFAEAADDRPEPASELYQRFFGWVG